MISWQHRFLRSLLCIAIVAVAVPGCKMLRGKGDDGDSESGLRDLMKVPEPPKFVGDAAATRGMEVIQVDSVGAINALENTGGPADPSPYRDQLVEEMKRVDVADPDQFLERPDTALCLVRGFIPPGAKRGDQIDLAVLTPDRSRATDLRGGWLLNTRMRHQRLLDRFRQSEVLATGTGYVLTRASYDPSVDDNLKIEGRVLKGGVVQQDRKINLVLRPKYKHVKMSSAISKAINRRYFFFDGTTRRGIAKAVEDDLIELEIHPRYADNLPRMIASIMAIGVRPESTESQKVLAELSENMRDPDQAAEAAVRLEAIGESAIPTLLEHVKSDNQELRFYAAESLAYLDRAEAIDPLVEAARNVAAFRQPALLALQGMPHLMVVDGVKKLFDEPSIETRYGAFVTIRRRDEGARQLGAIAMKDALNFYALPSAANPAVIVSLREEPELIVFGEDLGLRMDKAFFGPGGMILKADPDQSDKIRISRFRPGKQDRRVVVDNTIRGIAEGVIAVGCGYGDIIEVLRNAKESGALKAQLAMDPLPKGSRKYFRESDGDTIAQKDVLN